MLVGNSSSNWQRAHGRMLKNKRPGFVAATALNSPVVQHTLQQPQHVSKDEVLQFLDEFIVSKDGPDATETETDISLSAALSQLKRVQRDFKGLPPMVLAESTDAGGPVASATGDGSVARGATGGTKTTFDE